MLCNIILLIIVVWLAGLMKIRKISHALSAVMYNTSTAG